METYYRDYGSLSSEAPNNEVQVTRRSQVFQATHGGDGRRLPLMNRSFISFTFGGKPIEDFNLIATINGNSLNRVGYADFEDTVSNYSNLDGQQYWSTHFKNNSLEFILSTDGIDQQMLDSFLYWFRAGDTKELVLAEHPNRAILARVAQPPHLDLLPFEQQVTHMISDVSYQTSTTLYKGNISLVLIMDEPHWYAIMNLLGRRDENNLNSYSDQWWDPVTESWVNITDSKDALKVLYEDGIPVASMINNNMLLGNGEYANVENNTDSLIWSLPEASIVWDEGEPSGVGARISGTITNLQNAVNSRFSMATETYAGPLTMEDGTILSFDKQLTDSPLNGELIMSETQQLINMEDDENIDVEAPLAFISDWRDYAPGKYNAMIAGPIISDDGNGISELGYLQSGYFFYSGTAPSPTVISFTLFPKFNSDGYICIPANSYAKNEENPYNILTIESVNKQELRFTTPNLYTSYNKVNEISRNYISTTTKKAWIDLREKFREDVRHPAVREWANKVIDECEGSHVAIDGYDTLTNFKTKMQRMFVENNSMAPATFIFNSETGKAKATFKYHTVLSTSIFVTKEEDVGDMLRSNYIIIRDRNYATTSGQIVAWQQAHPEYSHKVYHDVNGAMTNLQILYKNMYL